jgi:hypothetical protein
LAQAGLVEDQVVAGGFASNGDAAGVDDAFFGVDLLVMGEGGG